MLSYKMFENIYEVRQIYMKTFNATLILIQSALYYSRSLAIPELRVQLNYTHADIALMVSFHYSL